MIVHSHLEMKREHLVRDGVIFPFSNSTSGLSINTCLTVGYLKITLQGPAVFHAHDGHCWYDDGPCSYLNTVSRFLLFNIVYEFHVWSFAYQSDVRICVLVDLLKHTTMQTT